MVEKKMDNVTYRQIWELEVSRMLDLSSEHQSSKEWFQNNIIRIIEWFNQTPNLNTMENLSLRSC